MVLDDVPTPADLIVGNPRILAFIKSNSSRVSRPFSSMSASLVSSSTGDGDTVRASGEGLAVSSARAARMTPRVRDIWILSCSGVILVCRRNSSLPVAWILTIVLMEVRVVIAFKTAATAIPSRR